MFSVHRHSYYGEARCITPLCSVRAILCTSKPASSHGFSSVLIPRYGTIMHCIDYVHDYTLVCGWHPPLDSSGDVFIYVLQDCFEKNWIINQVKTVRESLIS